MKLRVARARPSEKVLDGPAPVAVVGHGRRGRRRLVVVGLGLDLDDAPPPFRSLAFGVGPRQIDRGLALDGGGRLHSCRCPVSGQVAALN